MVLTSQPDYSYRNRGRNNQGKFRYDFFSSMVMIILTCFAVDYGYIKLFQKSKVENNHGANAVVCYKSLNFLKLGFKFQYFPI